MRQRESTSRSPCPCPAPRSLNAHSLTCVLCPAWPVSPPATTRGATAAGVRRAWSSERAGGRRRARPRRAARAGRRKRARRPCLRQVRMGGGSSAVGSGDTGHNGIRHTRRVARKRTALPGSCLGPAACATHLRAEAAPQPSKGRASAAPPRNLLVPPARPRRQASSRAAHLEPRANLRQLLVPARGQAGGM